MSFALRGLKPGSSTIEFAYATLADDEAQPLEFTTQAAAVQVISGITVTGQVYLQGVKGYAGGIEVKLIDVQQQIVATTITDAVGNYRFEHNQAGQPLPSTALAVYAKRPVYLSGITGFFTPLTGATSIVPISWNCWPVTWTMTITLVWPILSSWLMFTVTIMRIPNRKSGYPRPT